VHADIHTPDIGRIDIEDGSHRKIAVQERIVIDIVLYQNPTEIPFNGSQPGITTLEGIFGKYLIPCRDRSAPDWRAIRPAQSVHIKPSLSDQLVFLARSNLRNFARELTDIFTFLPILQCH
jgi:hypothetical protein